jgi:hypothetical protein
MEVDIKKAVMFLLSEKYYSEFESIDGTNRHPDGLTFQEWLSVKGLLS